MSRVRAAARTARIVGVHARLSAQQELQYRTHFWTYLVNSLVALGLSIASIWIVFSHTDSLASWSANELLVLVGVFFVINGVIVGTVHMSLSTFASDVHLGSFDFRLLKPVDSQLLALVRTMDVWRLLDVAVGLATIVVGLTLHARAGGEVSVGGVLVGSALVCAALLLLTAFWAMVASIVFWSTRLEGVLWALDELLDVVRWPLAAFPAGLRMALTFLFPAGLAISVPAEWMTGSGSLGGAGLCLGLTVVALVAARVAWLRGLANYASASS